MKAVPSCTVSSDSETYDRLHFTRYDFCSVSDLLHLLSPSFY